MNRVFSTILVILVLVALLFNGCTATSPEPEPKVADTPEIIPIPIPNNTPVPPPTSAPEPVVVNYELVTNVNPTEGGSVSPSNGYYKQDTPIDIIATPSTGYTFDHWDGDVSSSSKEITISMDNDKNIVANFSPLHTLTTSVHPVDSGSIICIPDKPYYENGESVTLKATAFNNYTFECWEEDSSDTNHIIKITMDSDITLIANFIDITPPIISGIDITNITDTKAVIKWNTDEIATSQVIYGKTTMYDSNSVTDKTLITSHSLKLIELIPNTTYHLCIKSSDKDGNEAESDDYTFNTRTTYELLSSFLYPGITIGSRVHQLSFNLFNGSSSTININNMEIYKMNGDIAFTMSKEDIIKNWAKSEIGAGKSLSAGISFAIPPTTTEVEDWYIIWYCVDSDRQCFPVKGFARKPNN